MKLLFTIVFSILPFLQQTDSFVFKNGNQKIVLKIDNGNRNLSWGKTSVLNLSLKNINPSKLNMSAPGIRYLKSKRDNEVNLEITPTKDIFKNDSLNLHVGYEDENKSYVHHKFTVLIKE